MPVSRLFLIDAHALCYRSFFAIKELRNTKGQATNAVYGFVAALKKILRDYQPQYLAVCFDMKGKTLRQEKFADYKIQRPAMPDDLISQIPIIQDVVAAYNLPVIQLQGYEADDIIATVARRFQAKDLEIVIVSDDKDMFQLVNDHVKVLNSRQDGILGVAEATKILGFSPHQIPDYLALAGDQVDNIPGVKGIGEVSAKKLLAQYGSLKDILLNVADLKPERVRQAMAIHSEMAQLSYQLALLEDQAPVTFDLETMRVGVTNENRLREIFTEMEFRKFAAELTSTVAETKTTVTSKRISTADEWSVVAETFKKDRFFSFYCEPLNAVGQIASPRKIFISGQSAIVYDLVLDNNHWLNELFADADIAKVTDDIKEQSKRLPAKTVFKGQVFDVMLAGYLASPARGQYDLPGLAWEYLKKTVTFASSTNSDPALRVMIAAELYPLLSAELSKRELLTLFSELEIPLAFVLAKMEQEGVSIDEELLSRLSSETSQRIDALTIELYALAGEEFNLNSPKQLGHILFEKLKLPAVKKTKTGFSTDEGVLLKLATDHVLPAKILEYRQLTKLRSTYIDALPKLIDVQTAKVHASFNQAVAETGRLSSSNPNLQNIPIRTELGRQIRAAFIPSAKDRVLISADYSQIELRVLAHLSGDANLKKAFAKNEDIHAYTAAQVFDVKESDVDAAMRNTAKRVNFGIIYGMSAFGLAKDLGINNIQAQQFIDRYFQRYPDVKKFMDQEIVKCRTLGYVTTILNRRRYIPEIHSPNMGLRQFAERQAINTPVQGSAADLIKLAMIQIAAELEKQQLKSRMIITVHDELVFDVVVAEEQKLITVIRDRMQNAMPLSVPIVATLKKGKNWLETEKI